LLSTPLPHAPRLFVYAPFRIPSWCLNPQMLPHHQFCAYTPNFYLQPSPCSFAQIPFPLPLLPFFFRLPPPKKRLVRPICVAIILLNTNCVSVPPSFFSVIFLSISLHCVYPPPFWVRGNLSYLVRSSHVCCPSPSLLAILEISPGKHARISQQSFFGVVDFVVLTPWTPSYRFLSFSPPFCLADLKFCRFRFFSDTPSLCQGGIASLPVSPLPQIFFQLPSSFLPSRGRPCSPLKFAL